MEDKKLSVILGNILNSSKNLAKLKIQLAKIESKEMLDENVGKAKNFIDDSISSLKLGVDENAKKYESVREERKRVIDEYRQQISKIYSENEKLRSDCRLEILSCNVSKAEKLRQRKELQQEIISLSEEDPDVSEEIKRLDEKISEMNLSMKSNDVDSILKYVEEVKPLIEQRKSLCSNRKKLQEVDGKLSRNEEEIEDLNTRIARFEDMDKSLKEFLKNELSDARIYKNDNLSIINQDTSFMNRVKGFFSSKLLGAKGKCKKVSDDVLKPFGKKVEQFVKEKLPTYVETMTKQYESSKDKIVDKSKQFICDSRKRAIIFGEKTKERAGEVKDSFVGKLKEGTNSIKEGVKSKFDLAVDFGRDVKIEIQKTVRDKAIQISEKMDKSIADTKSKIHSNEEHDEVSI